MFDDTIIAISTPLGYGGLGIVRLSGEKSLPIAKKIFKPKKKGKQIEPLHPILGNLYNFEDKECFEEAYLTYFPRPHTYTREDVVEISCHGSPVILEEIIRLGIKAGARHANPGEFTLRAYLNGRIDIIQAEAINDIIQAKSLKQAKISFHQLEGGLSKTFASLRDETVRVLSLIEASLEFPEEGLRISKNQILITIEKGIKKLRRLIESYDLGKTLSEGITLALVGRANVGKSTLFNSLIEKKRAIVTPFPGTTRDYLTENMKIEDSLFTLVDMAGFDTTLHPADREGIRRGKKLASEADGILLLLDASQNIMPEDIELIRKYRKKKTILLFNKIDLPRKINVDEIQEEVPGLPSLEISALKKTNLDKLKKMIYSLFVPSLEEKKEVILHLRQKLLLEKILDYFRRAKSLLKEGYSEEIYVQEIKEAIPLLGQLTGEIKVEEVIQEIFSRFCVGK